MFAPHDVWELTDNARCAYRNHNNWNNNWNNNNGLRLATRPLCLPAMSYAVLRRSSEAC